MLRHPRTRIAGLVLSAVLVVGLAAACSSEPEAAPSVAPTTSSSPVSVPSITSSSSSSSVAPSTSESVPPPVVADPDPLTGGERSQNPVVAVKIDNTSTAVDQFGVNAADIVYVQQVEGGLSRLIAVYHSNLDAEVGPVRSVRSTDAELLPAFGTPALAFSGGANGPMGALAASSVIDASGWEGFFRSSQARAPYNLHVNLAELVSGSTLEPARPIGLTFAAEDARLAAATPATEVSVRMPAATTAFEFENGSWQRVRDGNPVQDFDGTPQTADNVVVQWVQAVPDGTTDSAGSASLLSHTVGTGEVSLFRDGVQLTGTWSRASEDAPFAFVDGAGVPLPFKPGRTWVILATQASTLEAS